MPRPIRRASAAFAGRYRTKYGGEPVRTATLAYDAVALVAALSRTQGAQRFAPETLTNPSGFAGIDGLFRFRSDGTNERGLAVMKVAQGGGYAGCGFAEEFWRVRKLRGEIRHDRIEHRETGLRHPQPAVGVDDDRAFFAQHGDPAGIERAARQRGVALGIDALGEPQSHQQKFVGALFAS